MFIKNKNKLFKQFKRNFKHLNKKIKKMFIKNKKKCFNNSNEI